jgi:uncharacterized protein (UPF0212 family)
MADYTVGLQAAWPVRDVEDVDQAIAVAVSEAGRRLNEANKDRVEVDVGRKPCPTCGEPFDAALHVANTAMIGLVLRIDVFGVDNEEHATRVAKSEIGGALRDVPLSVAEVFRTDEDDAEADASAE